MTCPILYPFLELLEPPLGTANRSSVWLYGIDQESARAMRSDILMARVSSEICRLRAFYALESLLKRYDAPVPKKRTNMAYKAALKEAIAHKEKLSLRYMEEGMVGEAPPGSMRDMNWRATLFEYGKVLEAFEAGCRSLFKPRAPVPQIIGSTFALSVNGRRNIGDLESVLRNLITISPTSPRTPSMF